jgi:hypothetical protein
VSMEHCTKHTSLYETNKEPPILHESKGVDQCNRSTTAQVL